jgi:hypothetical protein
MSCKSSINPVADSNSIYSHSISKVFLNTLKPVVKHLSCFSKVPGLNLGQDMDIQRFLTIFMIPFRIFLTWAFTSLALPYS